MIGTLTVAGNLAAILADPAGAGARLVELIELERQAAAAEGALSARRTASASEQSSASAGLQKLAVKVAERRETIGILEGEAEELAVYVARSEEQWAGLGLPSEAPAREALLEQLRPKWPN